LNIGIYQKVACYVALFGLFFWQFALFVLTLEDEIKEDDLKEQNAKILDTISEEIGEVKLDAFGNIAFNQLLSIYKVCSQAGQAQFQELKKKFLKSRRIALQKKNMTTYSALVLKFASEEEKLVQLELQNLCKKINIEVESFNKSLDHYNQTEEQKEQIIKIQQEISERLTEQKDGETLSKEKIIEAYKVQVNLQLSNVDDMLKIQEEIEECADDEDEVSAEKEVECMGQLIML